MGTTSILVVDDNDDLRSLIQYQLKNHGFAVRTAIDPIEAMELIFGGTAFDLILSDLQMPKASGIDFFKALQEGFSHIPFILMSGSLAVDEQALEKMGIHYFISKPFSVETLTAIISTALVPLRAEKAV